MRNNQAVGYVRVSTLAQECSLEVQQARITAYCQLAGLSLVAMLIEDGASGKTRIQDRPEGRKIADLLSSGVAHVVSMKIDRLFRNCADALIQCEEWQRSGVALHVVDMGGTAMSTTSAMGKMMLTMLAGFAEFERMTIVERTTAVLRHKKASGMVFNHIPYGKMRASEGRLIDDPAEQAVVASMSALRASGVSYQGIADHLMTKRVPTKTGRTWHAQTVKSILAA